jgi:hypothetical protein
MFLLEFTFCGFLEPHSAVKTFNRDEAFICERTPSTADSDICFTRPHYGRHVQHMMTIVPSDAFTHTVLDASPHVSKHAKKILKPFSSPKTSSLV